MRREGEGPGGIAGVGKGGEIPTGEEDRASCVGESRSAVCDEEGVVNTRSQRVYRLASLTCSPGMAAKSVENELSICNIIR